MLQKIFKFGAKSCRGEDGVDEPLEDEDGKDGLELTSPALNCSLRNKYNRGV
ncbi:hypothetical protein AGMMS50222_00020 [Endomicrobiia bacterium]|nr:hypothetical protein AGMMS49531_00420 [Endomicrobiia bacterium]GHT64904.1 hypothetical protein AGMMS49556_03780 [Endomicrobiia bacterium]GHT71724.1 hypothetical protein AGMMS49950_08870 [Endomicrobiia bacterium]GHT73096.1 hypothetical protein AGMMS50222_00020 [Endomicrobiia bacterium]